MAKYQSKLNVSELVAIDVHTHANVSQRQTPDPAAIIMDEAMAKYFKSKKPPTIPELAQYYRERKMAAVIFTVDSEAEMGHWRIANEEVASPQGSPTPPRRPPPPPPDDASCTTSADYTTSLRR